MFSGVCSMSKSSLGKSVDRKLLPQSLKESVMGRGDKRSRKGKIFKGSYGNVRPHRVAVYIAPAAVAVKAAPKTLSVKKK
jgi:ribosomal small subunit protein bTHX